ncbi:MAG: 2-amino-4-hydroxy-6-hydroxymethyldihydropteridine diphosphokinase [Pseudomonadota bacterium]
MTTDWRKAWIGLGGNIGDVPSQMMRAIDILASNDEIRLAGVSGLYATEPWGLKEQAEFKNACIEISTSLEPKALLEACLATEAGLDRIRDVRWGPRTIDLDILAMEDVAIDIDGLTIPHSRLHERAFALVPLADLAPDLKIDGQSILELLEKQDCSGVKQIAAPGEWIELSGSSA